MITRRGFARHLSCLATAGPVPERGIARAACALQCRAPLRHGLAGCEREPGKVHPKSALDAIVPGAAATARYHFDEFGAFTEALAYSEELSPEQVLFGIGSR